MDSLLAVSSSGRDSFADSSHVHEVHGSSEKLIYQVNMIFKSPEVDLVELMGFQLLA